MRSLKELEEEYDDMNRKNCPVQSRSRLIVRTDLTSIEPEQDKCLAISTFGNWDLSIPTWSRFLSWLAPLNSVGITYTPTSSQGRLHWTLQQCMPFGTYIDLSGADVRSLQPVLNELAGVKILYRGIVATPAGIALRGFPASQHDYDKILYARSLLRESLGHIGIPYNPPYTNTICHSTVFRWTAMPTIEQCAYVSEGLARWGEAHIATLRPYEWSLGYMTLRCRESDNDIMRVFHTPLRIAHRGLLCGPDADKENTVNVLEKNGLSHIVSECDVWFLGESYYLGHDEPTVQISLEWLVTNAPWLLIHAKTPATFHQLQRVRNTQGVDLHLFYHTDEDIVLTTHGHTIAYPGINILPGWVSMMPERVPDVPTANAGTICSDYAHY